MLPRHPGVGRHRSDLAADLRSFPVGTYILFFRRDEDGIDLVRVLSGQRDILPDMMS